MRLTSPGPTRLEQLRAVFDEATCLAPDLREELVRRRLADRPDLLAEALAMLRYADDDEVPSAADSAGPAAGQRVGRFTLAERFEHGGASEVWLAWDGAKPVVLKLGPGGQRRSRLATEAAMLAKLDGVGVSRLLEHGQAELNGRARVEYLATEWAEGQRLDQWREAHAADPRALTRTLATLCGVIARAHGRGIVHGDLKPSNIIVADDGRVTVLDLGASVAIGRDAGSAAVPAGTPGYAAPELLRPGSSPSPRSDVFALGVIAYEMLAGVMPCRDNPPGAAARPLSELAPEARGDLARIVHRAMHPQPKARYASAGALHADLLRFMAGRPIEAPPAPLRHDLAQLVRRHKFATLAAVVIAASLIGLLLLLWRESNRTLEAQARAISARDMLLDLAHESLARSDQLLHTFPGPTEARQHAAAMALETLERIAQNGPVDEPLLLTVAEARIRLAKTLGLGMGDNLGRREDALAEIALAIDQLQAQTPPLTQRARLALARALMLRWGVLPDIDEAGRPITEDLDRSGSLLEAALAEDPQSHEARALLAEWTVLAAMHRSRQEPHHPMGALRMLDRAAAMLEDPVATARIAAPYRADLTAWVWRHRAIVQRQAGDPAAAEFSARRALQAIGPLADAEHPPAWFNRHAAIVSMELAFALATRDPVEASRLAHESLDRIAAVRAADPRSFPARRAAVVLPLQAAMVLTDAAQEGALPAQARRALLDSAQRLAADAVREVDVLAAEGMLREWETHYPAAARAVLDRAHQAALRLADP